MATNLCAYVHKSGAVCHSVAYDLYQDQPRCANHKTSRGHLPCKTCGKYTYARDEICTSCQNNARQKELANNGGGSCRGGRVGEGALIAASAMLLGAAVAGGCAQIGKAIEDAKEEKARAREHLAVVRLSTPERGYFILRASHEALSLRVETLENSDPECRRLAVLECKRDADAKRAIDDLKARVKDMEEWGVFGRITGQGETWLTVELYAETPENELLGICRLVHEGEEKCVIS